MPDECPKCGFYLTYVQGVWVCLNCEKVLDANPPEPVDRRPDPPPAPPESKRMCDACKDSGFTDVPDDPGYVQTCLRCDNAALIKRVEMLEEKLCDVQKHLIEVQRRLIDTNNRVMSLMDSLSPTE